MCALICTGGGSVCPPWSYAGPESGLPSFLSPNIPRSVFGVMFLPPPLARAFGGGCSMQRGWYCGGGWLRRGGLLGLAKSTFDDAPLMIPALTPKIGTNPETMTHSFLSEEGLSRWGGGGGYSDRYRPGPKAVYAAPVLGQILIISGVVAADHAPGPAVPHWGTSRRRKDRETFSEQLFPMRPVRPLFPNHSSTVY